MAYAPITQADVFANKDGQLSYARTHQNLLDSYTHLVRGGFGCGGPMDLFCYDAVNGRGDVYTTDPRNNLMSIVQTYPSLRKWCRQVVVGNWCSSGYDDLLFYEPSTGTIDIYQVNQGGRLSLLKTITGVRTSWTSLVAGRFGGDSWSDLFCYDAATGLGEFHVTDGQGTFTVAAQHTSLRKGCTLLASGNFGPTPCDDLLFYQPTEGIIEFQAVDKLGKLTPLKTHSNQSTTWSFLLTGNYGGDAWTDVILADKNNKKQMDIYRTDGKGELFTLQSYAPLPDWSHLLSGRFSTPVGANEDLLGYYQRQNLNPAWPALPAPQPITPSMVGTGRGEVYTVEGRKLRLIATNKGMPSNWSHVIAGNFGGPDVDLFCYDTATGRGEILGMDKDGKLITLGSYPEKFFTPGIRHMVTLPGPDYTPLAFLHPSNGTIEIFTVDGPGKVSKHTTSNTGITTWTAMAAGYFDNNSNGDVAVYDAGTGTCNVYSQDSAGALNLLASNTRLPTTWTRIIPGTFGASGPQYTHLLTFIASNGRGKIYRSDGAGRVTPMGTWVGLRKNFVQIVPGRGGAPTSVPLICYDPVVGEVELTVVTFEGGLMNIGGQTGLPKDWTQVAAREMGSAQGKMYLFCYSPSGG
ncbi:MAG: hypothetical protein QM582_09715 [Micropruina sp.]|uniref:hypothetical protein n=1 Tax=Micropruina sp. TaxID=2737536 RepID=UPI0039E32495